MGGSTKLILKHLIATGVSTNEVIPVVEGGGREPE